MAKIFTSSNMGSISSGIKWNIKTMSPTEYPNYDSIITNMQGRMGDVWVVTDENLKRLRYVANVFDGYEPQNDSINIYINESSDEKRINFFNGWYFDAKFNSQSILINGQNLFCPVYFWNEFQGRFEAVQIGYVFKDRLMLSSFTGQDLDVDTYWSSFTYSEEYATDNIPPVVVDGLEDNLSLASFTGQNLDVDSVWGGVIYSEDIIIKVNNEIVVGNEE